MTLPLYEFERPCPKCGETGARTTFEEVMVEVRGDPKEWMQRACKRCGYIWNEAPLDSVDMT